VCELADPVDVRAVEALFTDIWQARAGHPPLSADVMRSLAHFGGYVAGAYAGNMLVGACVGFLGAGDEPYLHSHITGVSPQVQGRGVGYALKCDQRAWALEHGIPMINWTFDPLVRRNGFFNLVRLGAVATSYLVDFYGEMADGINAGQGSDRLVAVWSAGTPARPPATEATVDTLITQGWVLLDVDAAGAPEPGDAAGRDRGDSPLLCRMPADIEALRADDPALAREWRSAVREMMAPAIDDGYRVTSATRSGWYLLEAP